MNGGSHREPVAQPAIPADHHHVDLQQADWWQMDDWPWTDGSNNGEWTVTDSFTECYPSLNNSNRARDRSVRGYNRRRAGSGQRATAYRGFFRALGRLRDCQY